MPLDSQCVLRLNPAVLKQADLCVFTLQAARHGEQNLTASQVTCAAQNSKQLVMICILQMIIVIMAFLYYKQFLSIQIFYLQNINSSMGWGLNVSETHIMRMNILPMLKFL